ncbi:MFS transporter [Pseudomonas sp. RIT778]|uniref:MFS transporter n=1 Tax=Pseudomonas sp. RIT778 TaxID=2870471 RepID=UPI001C86F0B3|nr:MFS transporter [Pseudomonas sp. RIT778]MBX8468867.1 MFS transporter [Pseudomonas sp. RIT778]
MNRSAAARPGVLLMIGILLASLTEAIAGTALVLGRNDIIGDTAATPDEFAWLDIGYTGFKLIGFLTASWLLARFAPRNVIVAATLAMGLACAIAAGSTWLDLLIALRILQGFAGGTLLVAAQVLIFRSYRRQLQPALQALFAIGAVVASATLTPALQGWLVDSQSWNWIFLSVVPLAMIASGLLLITATPTPARASQHPFDGLGVLLSATALLCFTYVLSQGERWDWFEAPRIVWLTLLGSAALLGFLGQQLLSNGKGVLDFSLFRSSDFSFAFIVSFVAGAALFGSAYLIPAFAVSVLGFTLTDAGLLLLPSGALFVGALLIAAWLMQARGVAPFATVPFGILMIMIAMWLLSGSTRESGSADMMGAILLRGLGLGFLFLSITLIAFTHLNSRNLAAGIGLFNTGRQLGGLIGVAGLQTLIEHGHAANAVILGSSVTPGSPALIERLTSTGAWLTGKGMEPAAAARAATSLLGRTVSEQSLVIAFDSAFMAVTLLFAVAAPLLVAIKIGFAKHAGSNH